MDWRAFLVVLVIVNIMTIILTKLIADSLENKTSGVFFQFLFSALLSLGYAAFFDGLSFTLPLLLIALMGLVNSFGNYCFWKAMKLSMSKTSLFIPLIDVMAIILAIILLQEAKDLTWHIIFGAALCFVSIWLFRSSHSRKEKANAEWLAYMATCVIIAGIGTFLMKVFTFSSGTGTFLVGWYGGSLVGASLLSLAKKEKIVLLSAKHFALIFFLSLSIVGFLGTLFYVFGHGGPMAIVLPIKSITGTIFPVLIGWVFFSEYKQLRRREYLAFAVGILGIV